MSKKKDKNIEVVGPWRTPEPPTPEQLDEGRRINALGFATQVTNNWNEVVPAAQAIYEFLGGNSQAQVESPKKADGGYA